MLDLLKKLFSSRPTVNPCADAPYKIETPETTVGTVPVTTQYADAPKVEPKKPAVKAKATSARTSKAVARKTSAKKPATKK